MSETLDPADVLEAAADALFVHGRCTGTSINPDGSMCVRGAIAHAKGMDPAVPWNVMAQSMAVGVRELEAYLYTHPDVVRADVFDTHAQDGGYLAGRFPSWIWNDTTHGPDGDALVIDTLRRCAKDLRALDENRGAA